MSREESLSIENLIWRLYSILVSLCLATMLSRLLLCITSQKKLKSSLKQIFEAKPKWLKKKHFYGCIGAVKHLFTASLFSLEMKEMFFHWIDRWPKTKGQMSSEVFCFCFNWPMEFVPSSTVSLLNPCMKSKREEDSLILKRQNITSTDIWCLVFGC